MQLPESQTVLKINETKENYILAINTLGLKIGKSRQEIQKDLNSIPNRYVLLKSYYAQAYNNILTEEEKSEKYIFDISQQFYFGIFDRLKFEFEIDNKKNNEIIERTKKVFDNPVDINSLSKQVREKLDAFLKKPTADCARAYTDAVYHYIRVLKTEANNNDSSDFKALCHEEINRQKDAMNETLALIKHDKLGVKYAKNKIQEEIYDSADAAFNRYIDSLFRECLGSGLQQKSDIANRLCSTVGTPGYENYKKINVSPEIKEHITALGLWTIAGNFEHVKGIPDIRNSVSGRLDLLDRIISQLGKYIEKNALSTNDISDLDGLIKHFEKTKQIVEKQWAIYHTPGRSHLGEYGIVNPRIFLERQEESLQEEKNDLDVKQDDVEVKTVIEQSEISSKKVGEKKDSIYEEQESRFGEMGKKQENSKGKAVVNLNAIGSKNDAKPMEEMKARLSAQLDGLYERTKESVQKTNMVMLKKETKKGGFFDGIMGDLLRPAKQGSSDAQSALHAQLNVVLESKEYNSIEKSLQCIRICNGFIVGEATKNEYLIDFAEHTRMQFVAVINSNKEAVNFYASDKKEMQRIYKILKQKDNYDIQKLAEAELGGVYGKFCDLFPIPPIDKKAVEVGLKLLTNCETAEQYDAILTFFMELIKKFSGIDTLWSRHYRDVLVEVCCKIIETHYLGNIQNIHLDFSRKQFENAKQILELISPYQSKERLYSKAYTEIDRSINHRIRWLQYKIDEKNKDPNDVTRLMVHTKPTETTNISNFLDGVVVVDDIEKLTSFGSKLKQLITAHTLTEYVISTGRLTAETSDEANVLKGTAIFTNLLKTLPIPADLICGGIDAADQKYQEYRGKTAVSIMEDLPEWLELIKEKLIPKISKIFKHLIMEMENVEDAENFAEFCQKRMFNAIRSGAIRGNIDEALIVSIYDAEYDDLSDSMNPLYGRYHKKGDDTLFGASSFQEMLANAPIAVKLKDDDTVKIFLESSAVKKNENGMIKRQVYSLADFSELPDIPKKIGTHKAEKIGTKRPYDFKVSSAGQGTFFNSSKSYKKKKSSKTDRQLKTGETLAEFTQKQLAEQVIVVPQKQKMIF